MVKKTLIDIFEERPPFNEITLEVARQYIHEDCVIHEPPALPFGGDWKGPEGFMALMGRIQHSFPNAMFQREALIADDEKQQLAFKGRLSGDAKHGRFEIYVVEYWTFRDNKAVDILPVWHDLPEPLENPGGTAAPR